MRLKATLQVRNGSRSLFNDYKRFYARQHVMLQRVFATTEASFCPSVRLSVTLLYCVQTTQLRIMKSSLWATARTSFFVTNFRAAGWGDSPRTRASNKGTPPPVKSRHFTTIGSSSVKTVAHRHRLAAYHNKHCWRAFQRYQHRWPWTTLNPKNRVF